MDCRVTNIIHTKQLTHSIAYKGNIISEQNVESGVTILEFPSQKDAEMHYDHANRGIVSQSVTFRPILQFHENGILRYHIWVGHNQGVPLGEFIDNSALEFWEYEKVNGIYIRASTIFRKLGKLVASLMYRLHKEDLFIGGNLMNHIFVNGDGTHTPLSLTVMGYQGHQVFRCKFFFHLTFKFLLKMSTIIHIYMYYYSFFLYIFFAICEASKFVDGVWDDLDALRGFVKHVDDTKKMHNCGANNAQKRENLYDLNMFYKLFPSPDDRPHYKKQIL